MTTMMLPAGRTADLRHLQWSEDMQCWTVRCGSCGEDWPCTEEFYALDGRLPAAHCNACRAERHNARYHAHHRSAQPMGANAP